MQNIELSRIMDMLQNTYEGAAWHGSSIVEVLNTIPANKAFRHSEHIHRICELVQHITAWRIFAIKRLEGDVHYEVTQNENWKACPHEDEKGWEAIKKELSRSQERLLMSLEKANDQLLDEEVEGKAYAYYTLIHGVIQHDLYHLGQIALLVRMYSD